MLGEHTALALGVLVAADVLDTVLKPAHAYQLGTYVILCSRKLEKKGENGRCERREQKIYYKIE